MFLSVTESRARLKGMTITGRKALGSVDVFFYKDIGNATTCSDANTFGTSVCDDVILIPVNSGTEVQYLTIVVNNILTLCEVQIFAGTIYKHVYVLNLALKQIRA